MKVKFTSRRTRTTPTPFFVASMSSHMVPLMLFFLCASNIHSVSGQRVVWLYKMPKLSTYHKLDYYPSSIKSGSAKGIEYTGVSSDSRAVTRNLMKIVPLFYRDRSPSGPTIFQMSTSNAPLITPLTVRSYGYGSGMRTDDNRHEPYYYDNQRMNYFGGGRDVDENFQVLNPNTLMLPKNMVKIMERYPDDDADNRSNGSGSTEVDSTESAIDFTMDDAMSPIVTSAIVEESIKSGCPLDSNNQARFHADSGACYTVGTKGPCGKYMIYTASDNLNGHCECDQSSVDRPLVQIGEQCHLLYTQAMCPPGFWLTLIASNTEPECEPNPCYHHKMVDTYRFHQTKKSKSFTKLVTSGKNNLIPFKGECVLLNSPSRHCRREGELVLIPEGSLEPTCGLPKSVRRIHRRQVSNVRRFTCGRGMRRHPVTKRCVVSRTIVFG